jgi:hypothetical protein
MEAYPMTKDVPDASWTTLMQRLLASHDPDIREAASMLERAYSIISIREVAMTTEKGQAWMRQLFTRRPPSEPSASREMELLNLLHEAMPYMLNAASSQDSPPAEWVRKAHKAGGSLLAGYHAMNQSGVLPENRGGAS